MSLDLKIFLPKLKQLAQTKSLWIVLTAEPSSWETLIYPETKQCCWSGVRIRTFVEADWPLITSYEERKHGLLESDPHDLRSKEVLYK